jgi:hypothetical protein
MRATCTQCGVICQGNEDGMPCFCCGAWNAWSHDLSDRDMLNIRVAYWRARWEAGHGDHTSASLPPLTPTPNPSRCPARR